MPKVHRFNIHISDGEDFGRQPRRPPAPPPSLSPHELRGLYLLREKHVEDIVAAAVNLDEGQRRLALRLIEALTDHKRSLLS